MYLSAETLDDLLHGVLERLLRRRSVIGTSRGATVEMLGVLLKLRNPRARLSHTEGKGTIFSCLGELLWYLAGSRQLKFMTYYLRQYGKNSDDGETVHGAYGPRLYRMHGRHNQLENVVRVLKKSSSSRRAVIQLFDAADIATRPADIPCTCTIQLAIRQQRLEMFVSMRSNDAYRGLPHDVFAFTMLQELMARRLGVELGAYWHFASSLHLYVEDKEKAQRYLDEGFQSTRNVAMPNMPLGDQTKAMRQLVVAEARIREGRLRSERGLQLPDYWADLVRLLLVFKARKRHDSKAVKALKHRMTTTLYDAYIAKQQQAAAARPRESQTTFDFVRPDPDTEQR